ncbi:MAG: hypothetical protein EA376_03540 [Phycisphaeraceae bacterium]|nr:MAG: hypothetical protein EA376_03540 [Phycisphaeraceae bacterium]
MPMHADKVARIMFVAQIAALAAGAGAVAMFLANPFQDPESIVETRAAADIERPRGPVQEREARTVPSFEHTDWLVVLPSISWAAPDPDRNGAQEDEDALNAMQQAAGEQDAATDEAQPPESRPLVNWRYIGYLRQADSMMALLQVENRQQFVGVGQKLNDMRIVSISAEEVRINDGLHEQRIQLASRTDTLPSKAPPAGPMTMPMPGIMPEGEEFDLERRRENIQRERERELERMRRNNPSRTEEWTPS